MDLNVKPLKLLKAIKLLKGDIARTFYLTGVKQRFLRDSHRSMIHKRLKMINWAWSKF